MICETLEDIQKLYPYVDPNEFITLEYDYKHCPSCGTLLSTPVRTTVTLEEPTLGFAGSCFVSRESPDDVEFLQLLCNPCFDNARRPVQP